MDWTVVKDVVVSIAAATGAAVAVVGLGTWRRQLHGGAEYELARRILRATYRLREALKHVRSPTMYGNEMPFPPDPSGMSPEEVRYYGTAGAYNARWSKVGESLTELQAERLEAEALWGKELESLLQPLWSLQAELYTAVHVNLRIVNPHENQTTKDALVRAQMKRRDILYDLGDSDEFAPDVEKALQPIEAYLKPHLRR